MNRFKFLVSNGQKSLIAILTATLLTACGGGGGGGGGSDPAPTDPPPTAPPPSGTTITGAVTKGPLSGATVSFYNVDEMGQIVGAALDSTTTAEDGSFTIILDTTGDVLVESRGGVYIDESDEEPDLALKRKITLTSEQTLLSFLLADETTVAITPFTMSLVERARIMSTIGGGFSARLAQSRTEMSGSLGFDVFATVPTDPNAPASDATSAEIQYALLLGGLANAINNVSLKAGIAAPTYDLLKAVTDDLVDGTLDGKQFDTVIQVDSPTGPVSLATDVNFTNEINRFRNNNASNFSDTVTIPPVTGISSPNTAPVAAAGADQLLVARAATIALDGAASIDAESGINYSWSQTTGPVVSLSDATIVNPSFVAPSPIVGDRTLTFQLQVTDALGLIGTDTVVVTVQAILPLTFSVVDVDEFGDGIGEDIDGGGKLILSTDGTGQLFVEEGFVALTYTETGDVLRIEFPNGFLADDFDEFIDLDNDGQPEQFFVDEESTFFEFTLPDGSLPLPEGYVQTPNSLLLQTREVGVRTFTPVGNSFSIPDEPYEFNFFLEAFDDTDHIPFSITDGTEIVLPFNALLQFPELFHDEELYVDVFEFSLTTVNSGSGITENNQISFTWTVEADGHLKVSFANGESADYFRLGRRDSGDIVQAEYNLTQPFPNETNTQILEIRLSFEVDAVLPVFNALPDAAGIYSGLLFRDDLDRVAPISVRLNPDGTGSVEFEFELAGIIQTGTSEFGVCWSVFDESVRILRAPTFDLISPGSRESTPEFCAQLVDDDVGFAFTNLLFNVDGNQYRFFDTYSENGCGPFIDPNCTTRAQVIKNFGLRILDREILTAVPPHTVFDSSGSSDVVPFTLNLLANDIARGNPIDPSTFEIVLQPINGQISVNPSTNDVTYTPNAGGGRDLVQYRVRDTAGNLSNIGRWDIFSGQPIAAGGVIGAAQGGTASLDASSSFDNGTVVGYLWEQVSGDPVAIIGANSETASFVVPIQPGLLDTTTLSFRLTVTDDKGLQNSVDITYLVESRVPMALIGVEILTVPIQFGVDVEEGEFYDFDPSGAGTLTDSDGEHPFSWTSSASSIDLNFPGDGLLDFEFIDGELNLIEREFITSASLVLSQDGVTVDVFNVNLVIRKTLSDLMGNELFAEDLAESFVEQFYDRNQLNVPLVAGLTLTLPTNLTTEIPTIDSQNQLVQVDELTFIDASTGTAKFKNVPFTYIVGTENQLVVSFADGEVAEYYILENRPSGTVVGTKYFDGGGPRVYASLSFFDNVNQFHSAANAAGIYEARGRGFSNQEIEVPGSEPIEVVLLYHLRPDGTGVVEIPQIDPITGDIVSVDQSQLGICWQVSGEVLTVNRTVAFDQLYSGSRIPSTSHCLTVFSPDNTLISFQRESKLFDISNLGEQRTLTLQKENNCGLSPVFSPTPAMCDPTLLEVVATIPRVQKRIPYVGDPPIAEDTFFTVVDGVPAAFNISANIIIGSTSLDPASVEIVGGGLDGVTTVDLVTGIITYVSLAGSNGDELYYRVRDLNGNLSTRGKITITTMPPMGP